RQAARVPACGDAARVDAGCVEPFERLPRTVEDARVRVDAQTADRVRDRGGDVHRDARAGRRLESELRRIDDGASGGTRGVDPLACVRQAFGVEDVPGARTDQLGE